MNKNIGKILKESRILSGISVKEISDILISKGYKASESTIYSWENENSQPTPGAFLVMCDAYGIKNVLTTFGYTGYKEDGSIRLNIIESDIIEKYRSLDPHGKETVDIALERETIRVKELQKQKDRIADLEASPATIIKLPPRSGSRHLAEYFHDASAGSGIFILGNEATSQIAISDSDWDERTDFVIRVNGDSMKPDYMDGDNVMISQRVELSHGDVGIFVVNGKAYIKEYGETELISRNPNSSNIIIHEHDNIVCMGKVIGKLEGEFEIISN